MPSAEEVRTLTRVLALLLEVVDRFAAEERKPPPPGEGILWIEADAQGELRRAEYLDLADDDFFTLLGDPDLFALDLDEFATIDSIGGELAVTVRTIGASHGGASPRAIVVLAGSDAELVALAPCEGPGEIPPPSFWTSLFHGELEGEVGVGLPTTIHFESRGAFEAVGPGLSELGVAASLAPAHPAFRQFSAFLAQREIGEVAEGDDSP